MIPMSDKVWSNLAQVVYQRTYSRKDSGKSESWNDTVQRIIAGNIKGHNVPDQEIRDLTRLLTERKCGPAGRGYWFSGTEAHARLGGVALSNCFAYETEIITSEGIKKIGDCVGTSQTLLSRRGKWIASPIRSFGIQRLYKLIVQRQGVQKIIYTTANHRWFAKDRRKEYRHLEHAEFKTTELRTGHQLQYCFGQGIKGNITASPFGVAHGFAFGDGGSVNGDKNSNKVDLIGDKDLPLRPYFALCPPHKREDGEGFGAIPNFFRELPSIKETKSYLLGWLMGYLAADGSVSLNGCVGISSTELKNVLFFRDVCTVLGIGTYAVQKQDRVSNLTGQPSTIYTMLLMRDTLTEDFFLIDEHKKRYADNGNDGVQKRNWNVLSVEETDRYEEVYCASVPEEAAFTLEGNILTGNCWFALADDWTNFVLAQDLLMLGGGVGLSVEHRFVSKLPRVKKSVNVVHRPTKDADFIVPDSREGWNDLLFRVLEAFFVTGKSFSYSTICIRNYGDPIKGFGGVSSGPQPLIAFVEKLCSILIDRSGKSIRPIDAADIMCSIGEMVVSGNVRRSAIIILGDPWDKEYLKAKRWDLGLIPSQRSCANWSVVCDDTEDLHPSFWKTYEHGEPFGLVNRTNMQKYGRMGELKRDTAIGVNPCQPAWATVLTPTGVSTISKVSIGDTIWSGKRWTKVTNKWSTGVKTVCAFHTTAGTFYGTENHRIVQHGDKIEVKDAEAIDTCQGPLNATVTNLSSMDIVNGMVLGDGMFEKKANAVVLIVGKDDQDYFTSEVKDLIGPPIYPSEPTHRCVESMFTEMPKTYERKIPDVYRYASRAAVCGFLRGLYTANGSIIKARNGGRVTLKAASFDVISVVQEMLSSIGIRSYYTTNKANEVEFSNGLYECKQSYDLNITSDRFLFRDMIGFIQTDKTERLNSICSGEASKKSKATYDIVSKAVVGNEEVFDLTVEAEEHTYWTGGLLVSNCAEACLENAEPCNLQEIPLPNIESVEELKLAARLMHRWGKRVTMESYHQSKCDDVIKRNRRVGTGITGCLQSPFFCKEVLDEVYSEIQKENVSYSRELGIPESIRTTVVKPSGTLSKMYDMNGYEGIHASYSRYMIQRIRFASNDPLVPRLLDAGHRMEPVIRLDGTLDHRTVVVDFYQQAPEGFPVADEDWTLEKQLDTLLFAQRHWADQSVSVTIYYKKDEIPKLKEWLATHLCDLKSISFLCHSDHGFAQAPKEAISREQYEKLSSKIKPIDSVSDSGDFSLDGTECAGGICPVK